MRNKLWDRNIQPLSDKDVGRFSVFDGGDLELSLVTLIVLQSSIETYVGKGHFDSKVPFMIGGEHSVTIGAVRAVAKKYPDLHMSAI